MLTGYADLGRVPFGKGSQLQKQRAELNRFRPRTENKKDAASQLHPIVSQAPDLKH